MSPLERCKAEQESAAAYLIANGHHPGALLGWVDWTIEEQLIRSEPGAGQTPKGSCGDT